MPILHRKELPSFLRSVNRTGLSIPGNLGYFSCAFDITLASIEAFERLNLLLPEKLNSAVFSRKIEYLVGRYLAQQILSSMRAASFQVLTGANREPVWPSGYVGSISHSGNEVCCIVGRSLDYEAVGIDVQHHINIDNINGVYERISSPEERYRFTNLSIPNDKLCTLLFSTKESVFKALFPKVRKFFEFGDVEIVDLCFDTGSFVAEIKTDLSTRFHSGTKIQGQFFEYDERVETTLLLPQKTP